MNMHARIGTAEERGNRPETGTELASKPVVRRPFALLAAAIAAGALGLYFGWPTLVALGIAPLVVAVAPCALMCAVGYCTMRTARPVARDTSASGSDAGHETARSTLPSCGNCEERHRP
jgi:hypothetical protein